jgi:glc operon protein GlcG
MHRSVTVLALAALFLGDPITAELASPAPAVKSPDHPLVVRAPRLTLDGARAVIRGAQALAAERKVGGAVAVVDAGGELVAFERLEGTFAAGADVSIGKARTAALFKKPTRVFEELVNKGRTAMVAIDGFTPLIGGVPLVVDGAIVGAVGVSGASSAAEDEELALAGAAALRDATLKVGKADDVRLIPKSEVAAAFERGSTLVATPGLVVNASRRDEAGEAELHETDLDVFYILEGHASFVTGGELVRARRSGAGELRGASIAGGVERHLRAGDVVVVPAGVPHWFREVHEPVVYYVVKSS